MTSDDEEYDTLLRDYRTLTPDQHELLMRQVIGRARAYRAQAIRELLRSFFGWIRRRAAIAQLQALDDRMLKDIGINRGDIENVVPGPGPRPPKARSSTSVLVCGPHHGASRAA